MMACQPYVWIGDMSIGESFREGGGGGGGSRVLRVWNLVSTLLSSAVGGSVRGDDCHNWNYWVWHWVGCCRSRACSSNWLNV